MFRESVSAATDYLLRVDLHLGTNLTIPCQGTQYYGLHCQIKSPRIPKFLYL